MYQIEPDSDIPRVFKFIDQTVYTQENNSQRFSSEGYRLSELPYNADEVVIATLNLDTPEDLPVFLEQLQNHTSFGYNKEEMISQLMTIKLNCCGSDNPVMQTLEHIQREYYALEYFEDNYYFTSINIQTSLVCNKQEDPEIGLDRVRNLFQERLTEFLVNEEKALLNSVTNKVNNELPNVPSTKTIKI